MFVDARRPSLTLDRALAALADPTRRAILRRLAAGEATVTELGAPFDLTQPAVSHHLKVLEEAGLITRTRDGTRRPARLNPDGLLPLDAWLQGLRDALDARHARLDHLLAEPPKDDRHDPHR